MVDVEDVVEVDVAEDVVEGAKVGVPTTMLAKTPKTTTTTTSPPRQQTPSPSDLCALRMAPPQVSTGPQTCRDLRPVGACLLQYLPAWKEITQDSWVLDILTNGYAPQFSNQPPLTRDWQRYESITQRTPEQQAVLLQEHISELLNKRAIEPVNDPKSLGFYSHMFLVPKKNGKLRPIINLRELNNYLVIPSFKMETTVSVAAAVQPGDWATSLDLTDAYFHVPIAPWFRKFLRIVVNGKAYQYRALPFGLSTSPLVFTKVLQPVASYLHLRGINIHRYLDDLLIRSQSKELCAEWTRFTLALLFKLGLGVSLEKSDLDPAQIFKYIGILFLTALGIMTPPEDRISAIESLGKLLLSQSKPASLWLSFIGLLSSAEKQVPFGRLHIRPIHFCLRRQFLLGVHPLDRLVTADQEAKQAINWWLNKENSLKGQPLGQFKPDLTLNTDASMTGWGAHAPGFQASNTWTREEQNLSINHLELLAVLRAFQTQPEFWKGKKVLIATDNSTVVAYINHQGGTKSLTLLDLTYNLYELILKLEMSVRARHIPGRLNCLADLLSRRNQIVSTEWSLHPQVFKQVCQLWGTPQIDLMATSLNHKLALYVSPFPDPQAYAVDAMSLSWENMDAYLFPPWPLIHQVLLKLQSHNCVLTVILPLWPNSAWFPLVLQCLVDYPRKLQLRHDLIRMPLNNLRHGQIHSLNLHACRLSSTATLTKAFQKQCQREWLTPGMPNPHTISMIPSGRGSLFGVMNGVPIHSMLL